MKVLKYRKKVRNIFILHPLMLTNIDKRGDSKTQQIVSCSWIILTFWMVFMFEMMIIKENFWVLKFLKFKNWQIGFTFKILKYWTIWLWKDFNAPDLTGTYMEETCKRLTKWPIRLSIRLISKHPSTRSSFIFRLCSFSCSHLSPSRQQRKKIVVVKEICEVGGSFITRALVKPGGKNGVRIYKHLNITIVLAIVV